MLRFFLAVSSIAAGLAVASTIGLAQEPTDSEASKSLVLRTGLGGTAKAGRWFGVRVDAAVFESTGSEDSLELVCQDGDGLIVRYPQTKSLSADQSGDLWLYGKQGPVREEMQLNSVGANEETLGAIPLTYNVLPSTDRLYVVFGKLRDFDDNWLRRSGLKREPFSVVSFENVADFPDHWLGYDAVDTFIVTTGNVAALQQLTDRQHAALRHWVEMGGRLILSVGESGSELFGQGSGPWNEYLPGAFVGVSRLRSTSGLETYAKATQRIEPMQVVELSDTTGLTILHDGVGTRRDQPLVVESPFGFGRVTFVAFDLNAPELTSWDGRGNLLGKLIVGRIQQQESTSRDDIHGGKVTHYGYEDLTGQLRAALDQFSGVRVVAFSVVAGFVGLYILLIGPGDYFFLKRIVRRMTASWITFPLLSILFAVGAVVLVGAIRGQQTLVNQVTIVDVETERSLVRATNWAHVYSPRPQSLDLRFRSDISLLASMDDSFTAWQGLPGRGLGGLNAPSSGSLFPSATYVIAPQTQEGRGGEVRQYPLRASSTASFVGRTHGSSKEFDMSNFTSSGNANLLTGTVTNPLPVSLQDAAILYGEWIYLVTREWQPNETLNVDRELTPKNLSWRLTRRRVVDTRDISTPWDATTVQDIPRIVEMMMFHEAAGGGSYTRLLHRHQPQIEMSDHLRLGRAIVVGRVSTPSVELVREDSAPMQVDQQFTFYRFVLPVSPGDSPTTP
ncbi:MAG: hypothetical protein KDA55_11360 [Planctomycetales bacterium]|nr:hypothetical protein [Planctomycetales bacterium]